MFKVLNLLLDNPAGQDGRFNVGDDIQTLAAEMLMPRIDALVEKERISEYQGAKGKLILNGWFMHSPRNWPPPASIEPLVVSIHINPAAAERMLSSEGKAFFMKHAPIGCRDRSTLAILQRSGIPAYFSACLTLTLKRSDFAEPQKPRRGIVIADPLYKLAPTSGRRETVSRILRGRLLETYRFRRARRELIANLIGRDSLNEVIYVNHSCAIADNSHAVRKVQAMATLRSFASANLVITSRIHCALPCLAFGTPVLFVDSGLDMETEAARLDGLLELFHCVKFSERDGLARLPTEFVSGQANQGFSNKADFVPYRDALIQRCGAFLNG